jgi:poly(A) polymerase
VSSPPSASPRVLARPEHAISRSHIDANALKVLYRLHNAGYLAYLVGGGVRDLLLGLRPKDFDVGTDARPNDIRRLFRNSRIIGRRFRLVHVFFKDEIVEVSTFRRDPDPLHQEREDGELLITSDNTFGTPEEDAFRRDFTINALFYSIADFSVIDYVGGIDDLERRLVRVIGDPDLRFCEDPVRMVRACEFAGRLDFEIEERTAAAIASNRREILKASPARLSEELLQLLRCGQAARSFSWLRSIGLLDMLLAGAGEGEEGALLFSLLALLDRRVAANSEVSDVSLVATLAVAPILARRDERERHHGRPLNYRELRSLVDEVLARLLARFPLPNLKSRQLTTCFDIFHRMCDPTRGEGERRRLARRAELADALFLFGLLAEATGEGQEALAVWQNLQRQAARQEKEAERRLPRRRRRRRRGRGRAATDRG